MVSRAVSGSARVSSAARLVAAGTTMPLGLVETVRLGKELVEGLLAFVVPAHPGSPAATAADGVDEDDRRGPVACLLEEVAHP